MKQEPFIPKIKEEPNVLGANNNFGSPELNSVKSEPQFQDICSSKLPTNHQPVNNKTEPNVEELSESDSENSVDEEYRCPICLSSFKNQNSGQPEICDHRFCLECIEEWSKKTNTCPIDRKNYCFILANIYIPGTGKARVKKIPVENRTQYNDPYDPNDITFCEICHRSEREDRMLLCDGCDKGYHCECLSPPLSEIPEGQWFCETCQPNRNNNVTRLRRVRRSRNTRVTNNLLIRQNEWIERINRATRRIEQDDDDEDDDTTDQNEINDLFSSAGPSTSGLRRRYGANFIRPIARTRFMERIRHHVNENRIQRGGYIIETDEESDDESEDTEEDGNENESEMTSDSVSERESDTEESLVKYEPKYKLKSEPRYLLKYETKHELKYEHKQCSCVMCDETCQVNIQRTITKSGQKKCVKKTRRKRKTVKRTKTNLKGKRQRITKKRGKKRIRRVIKKSSAVTTQSKILSTIRGAKLQQIDIAKANSQNPITLNSIEKEFMNLNDNMSRKSRFPINPSSTAWYNQESILNEIDETNNDIPLSSMSLKKSKSDQQGRSAHLQSKKPAPSLNFLDSLLGDQKLLLTSASKIEVKRDGSLQLMNKDKTNLSNKRELQNSDKFVGCSYKKEMIESKNETSSQKSENNTNSVAYDPFNPDDSPDENDTPKITERIKFEIKPGVSKSEKSIKPIITDSPLNKIESENIKVLETSNKISEISVKQEVTEKHDSVSKKELQSPNITASKIKEEKLDVKTIINESRETTISKDKSKVDMNEESIKENKKEHNKSDKTSKRHRSRSPHQKKKSKTRSKSKSPKRDKSSIKLEPYSSRRSRSSSKTRRGSKNRKSSRERIREKSEKDYKSSHKSSHSSRRSRSPDSSKQSDSNFSKYSSSRSYRNNDDKEARFLNEADRTRNRSNHKDTNLESERNRTNKHADLKRPFGTRSDGIKFDKSPESVKKHGSKGTNNMGQKYSDFLIDEMMNEEKQQTIDIDKILLPISNVNTIPKKSISNDNSLQNKDKKSETELNKSNLDKRLNIMFGNSVEKAIGGNALKSNTKEVKEKSLSALEKDLVKLNNVKKEIDSKKKMNEIYDLESEYEKTGDKIKVNTITKSELKNSNDIKHEIVKQKITTSDKKPHSSLLNTQEKIVNVAKQALKPHFVSKKITKEDYKLIMKKVVTKSLHQNKTGSIVDTNKVNKMISEYLKNIKSKNGK